MDEVVALAGLQGVPGQRTQPPRLTGLLPLPAGDDVREDDDGGLTVDGANGEDAG